MLYRLRTVIPLTALLCALSLAQCAGAISNSRYYDKVRGAWLGKCIGGALGMPIESWRYWRIEKEYPNITGYVGYFKSAWKGWSGINDTVRVPKDGEWHRLQARVRVPSYDVKKLRASPIIGMSLEFSTAPATWEITNLRILRPASGAAIELSEWAPSGSCSWARKGVVAFDFNGERSWLKLQPARAESLNLKPGDILLLSFDAKWISGEDRIGFAFDYVSRELQKGFGPDDDTSYQIVGLHALETHGPDLSAKQIADEWRAHLPNISVGLAEGLALKRLKEGVEPPASGEHEIGEAIGGQMKGEIWGLICPGRPDLAAEYARRDGVVAHCKNGVYGEQFIAAMISAAFEQSDVRKLIEAGLSRIPADSKYTEVVREVIALHAKYPNWRDSVRVIVDKYPGICNPVYAEAGIVTLALLYGNGEFEKTLCIAAMCGNDTDCNSASVGALLGCIKGANAIPAKWKDPIDDSFSCFVRGFEEWRISDLARRICAAGQKVKKFHGSEMEFSASL